MSDTTCTKTTASVSCFLYQNLRRKWENATFSRISANYELKWNWSIPWHGLKIIHLCEICSETASPRGCSTRKNCRTLATRRCQEETWSNVTYCAIRCMSEFLWLRRRIFARILKSKLSNTTLISRPDSILALITDVRSDPRPSIIRR